MKNAHNFLLNLYIMLILLTNFVNPLDNGGGGGVKIKGVPKNHKIKLRRVGK